MENKYAYRLCTSKNAFNKNYNIYCDKQTKLKWELKIHTCLVDQMNQYVFLGALIVEDSRCAQMISVRFWFFNKFMSIQDNKNIFKRTKTCFLKCYVWLLFLYACESRTMPNMRLGLKKVEVDSEFFCVVSFRARGMHSSQRSY